MPAFYRTLGGSVLELDAPAPGTHAAERFAEQVAKGDLVLLDAGAVEKVVDVYGLDKDSKPMSSFRWVEKAPAAGGDRPAKSEATIEDVLAGVRGHDDGPTVEPAEGWEERAQAALEAEQAKGDKARKTLVDRLESALDAASGD